MLLRAASRCGCTRLRAVQVLLQPKKEDDDTPRREHDRQRRGRGRRLDRFASPKELARRDAALRDGGPRRRADRVWFGLVSEAPGNLVAGQQAPHIDGVDTSAGVLFLTDRYARRDSAEHFFQIERAALHSHGPDSRDSDSC